MRLTKSEKNLLRDIFSRSYSYYKHDCNYDIQGINSVIELYVKITNEPLNGMWRFDRTTADDRRI